MAQGPVVFTFEERIVPNRNFPTFPPRGREGFAAPSPARPRTTWVYMNGEVNPYRSVPVDRLPVYKTWTVVADGPENEVFAAPIDPCTENGQQFLEDWHGWTKVDGFDFDIKRRQTLVMCAGGGGAENACVPRNCRAAWIQVYPKCYGPQHSNVKEVKEVRGVKGPLAVFMALAAMSCGYEQQVQMFSTSMQRDEEGRKFWKPHSFASDFRRGRTIVVRIYRLNSETDTTVEAIEENIFWDGRPRPA